MPLKNSSNSSNPLYRAIVQLSKDIRTLLDLSVNESEDEFNRFISIARQDLENDSPNDRKSPNDLIFKGVVSQIYDYITFLLSNLKSTNEKYRRLATRDLLTGLYNRNYFNETIVRDIERAKRRDERLSFIVLDIDNFKPINDTFGHIHGDSVLRECAQILKKSSRKSDFVCRFGGDEFVIVTPYEGSPHNAELVKRIRAAVEKWNRKNSGIGYTLSFSIGHAVWEKGRCLLDVINEADCSMYEDKRQKQGR